ncbi:TIGR03936 family radical SAM-associated protein [Actinopolyspora xinjiangensis]|uniref:TIGR03936 family radical SAM-associated protein n=1 Tax=Actinopolyspora xinjiangensis TaxID=405564 RepID=UPI000B81A179|nr:TIGR03936 family radical SAM-associated protein [Actinopolyspora xinjiangensis]
MTGWKVRLRYTKRDRLRFASHRDLTRVFERALRRAGVPLAYSRGYSPHPRISWAGTAPTGVASEAEYAELRLEREVPVETLRNELRAALPEGLDVAEAVPAGAGSLEERLLASRWWLELDGVAPGETSEALCRLLSRDSVEVERVTRKGRRVLDVRAAVVSADSVDPTEYGVHLDAVRDRHSVDAPHTDDCPDRARQYGIIVMVVRHTTPVVRPDDVLNALRVVADLPVPGVARATRLAQGRLDEGGAIADPLAQDRAAAGSRQVGSTLG